MLSLLVHALLGLGVVWWVVRANPAIFRRPASGPLLSLLEIALYVVGVVSIGIGWYFNIRFVTENTDGWVTNPFVGDGSWEQYMKLLFDNPAAGSASGDFITANVVLLPLITIVGGRRLGIQKPWLFFVVTLFASFSFGWAFYAATAERQRRVAADSESVHQMAKGGDRIVLMAGIPFGTAGSTNVLHVVRLIGDELERHQTSEDSARK